MKKIGFIGCGNMGSAMMQGIIASGKAEATDIITSDVSMEALNIRKDSLGVNITTDNIEAAKFADILFLSVKPQYYDSVIAQIKDCVDMNKIIVTIAPGKTLKYLSESFGKQLKIIRTMPNTPAMVSEGMMALCPNENVTAEDLKLVEDICSGFSKTEVVGENLMDTVTAVSGSSPAYVFMFIEAMADAGVAAGLTRDKAYEFAASAVKGSAALMLETKKHPGELKDMVCSPAGTTIAAVQTLEQGGFRGLVMDAVEACVEKAKML